MEANGIVLSPDPRLRQECAVIEEITPAIEALAEKMKKMMFENGGCGLAAPQIGELIQLVTIDCDYTDKNDYDPYVLINPVIVEQSDHLVPFSEGCLSIPGISCEIERPDHVVVEAYDLDANLIRYEASGDLFCVCLQHEIDHLHGVTMVDHLTPSERTRALRDFEDALAAGARPGDGTQGVGELIVVHGGGADQNAVLVLHVTAHLEAGLAGALLALPDIPALEEDAAGGRFEQPVEVLDEGGFARAGVADDAQVLPGVGGKVHVRQGGPLKGGPGAINMGEFFCLQYCFHPLCSILFQ